MWYSILIISLFTAKTNLENSLPFPDIFIATCSVYFHCSVFCMIMSVHTLLSLTLNPHHH